MLDLWLWFLSRQTWRGPGIGATGPVIDWD